MFSSFWTSRRNLLESTLKNSGAIWRITVNKKVIKVTNWQWLRHLPCFWQSLSSFWQMRRNFDDGRPSAEEHPIWQVNRVQIRAIRWTKCLAQWSEGSHAASFYVSGGVRGSTVLLQWPFVTATSLLDVGQLVFAKHHVTWYFPPGWMKTTSA